PQYNYENIAWRFATSSQILQAPVSDGKTIVFANAQGSIHSVSPDGGVLNFQFEIDEPVTAALDVGHVMENGVDVTLIYAATGDTMLYALRGTNGTTKWLHLAGEPIREKPHVIGNSVFLVPVDAG